MAILRVMTMVVLLLVVVMLQQLTAAATRRLEIRRSKGVDCILAAGLPRRAACQRQERMRDAGCVRPSELQLDLRNDECDYGVSGI